jgi:hypothetical protein
MAMSTAALLLVFLAPAPASPGDTLTVVQGQVRAEGYRVDGRVPGAVIWIRQGERVRVAVADAEGRYRVVGLRGGEAQVRASHIATHERVLAMRLPSSGTVLLDLEMETRVLALPAVTARASGGFHAVPTEPLAPAAPPRSTLTLRALDASSGMVEMGLAGFAARRSTETGEPDRDRMLLTRGSTVDARAVHLDGAPILTPFHVAGLVSPFDGYLVGDATVHVGGAPARLDGGLSHLLELSTRAPRVGGVHLGGEVDGLAARVGLDVANEGWGLLLGGRNLHGMQERVGGGGFPYAYRDLLVRTHWHPRENQTFRLTGYLNREGVILDLDGISEGAAVPTVPVVPAVPAVSATPGGVEAAGPEGAHWGNRALSAGYAFTGRTTGVEAVVAASRYRSELPLDWHEPLVASGRSDRFRGALEVRREQGSGELRLGLSADATALEYRLDPRRQVTTTSIPTPRAEVRSASVGGHLEWEGAVAPGVRLRVGSRADHHLEAGRFVLGPRATLDLLLSERALLTLSAGRHHLAVPLLDVAATLPEQGNATLAWSPALDVASATHLVVGVSQELEGGMRLDLTGFMRRYDGQGTNPFRGLRASGTDLRVARDGERLQAWLGYALTWFWEEAGPGGSDRFDGRHLLSAGGRSLLPRGLVVEATLGYGSGLPLSAVDVALAEAVPSQTTPPSARSDGSPFRSLASGGGAVPLDVARQDEMLRLDLELSWTVDPEVGGRTTRLRPYLRVLNALDRRDALFHYFDRWRDEEVRPVATRPFLPLLGVEWRF